MKRFKNILYILDETTISQGNSAEKVANIARLNKAKVTTLIAEEKARLDDLRLHISGRHNEIQRAILQQNTENLDWFISRKIWDGIDIKTEYPEASGFISIIQKVLRDKHDLVIKEEPLEHGIDQLTMRLVRKCPCPVWVIKSGSDYSRRILAAANLGDESLEARALSKKIIELTHSLARRENVRHTIYMPGDLSMSLC